MRKIKCYDNRDYMKYYCDDCGADAKYPIVCTICRKDLCLEHAKYESDTGLDSPPKYCERCFNLGTKKLFFLQLRKLEQQLNEGKKTIISKWRLCADEDSYNNSSL